MHLAKALRSPREKLGDYALLPRLIDKVRLYARGELPSEYHKNLLGTGPLTLDRRFLVFTGLDRDEFRQAILSAKSDKEVLAWVEQHARPHTPAERRQWASEIEAYRPDPDVAEYRRRIYPGLAARIDVAALSVFDIIDMDEGRMALPDGRQFFGEGES